MVGGWVIEVTSETPARIWVTNPGEGELCVHALIPPGQRAPELGEEVWWQGGKVFYDHDRLEAVKVGYSHGPEACREVA